MAKEAVESTVIVQKGDSKPQISKELSDAEAYDMVSKADDTLGRRLKEVEKHLQLIRDEILPDPDKTVEYFLLQYGRSRVDEILGYDLDGLDPAMHRSRVDEIHKYGGPGSVLLYRDARFSGGSKFFSATWPNFGWSPYRFHDTASSGKAWGGNIIFQHSWYGGRRLYMVGIPYMEIADFRDFDFDNIASSYVGLG